MSSKKLMEERNEQQKAVKTLGDLKAIKIYGNPYHDMPIFKACDRLCCGLSLDVTERLAVLDYMSNDVMGLGADPATEKDLNLYISTI